MYASLIITFLLILGVTVFALQNGKATEVKFLIWEYNSSLVLVILGSCLIGAAIMAIMTWPSMIKKHFKERRLVRQVRALENKAQGLEKQLMEKAEVHTPQPNHQEEQTEEELTPDQTESSF